MRNSNTIKNNKIISIISIFVLVSCGEVKKRIETNEVRIQNASALRSCGVTEVNLFELLKYDHFKRNVTKKEHFQLSSQLHDLLLSTNFQAMIDGTLDESSYNDDLKSRLFLLRNILNKIDENIENDEVKNLLFFKEQIDHIVKNKFSVENLELLSRLRQQIAIENKISEFFKLTSEIMIENSIPENMSPLIHDIGERDHKIRFMNLANKNVEDFSTSEENYRRYKFLREEIRNTLNVGEYNSLNRSFAVLALGKILSENKVSPEISAMKSDLAKMLLAHYYIGNTQIALGVVEEGIYLANVIRALNTIHTLEKMSVPIFSNIVGGLNSILMIPSIGLDIAELNQASAYNEKVVLGTQVGIDATGLGLAIASLAGSEVTGPLSVPFAGLGFAGQALNSRFAALNHQSLEIAKEFDHLKKEYSLKEEQYQVLSSDRPFLSFAYNFASPHEPKIRNSVIKSIDLSKKREIAVTFGDNYVMKTINTNKRNQEDGYYCFTCPNPSEELGLYQFENYCPHKNDYLGVRELLKLEQNKIINLNNEKFNKLYQENLEVMMPISPESYLWYEYGPSRGILSSAESEEIKTVYEMQNNSNNKFFFAFSEPIVNQAIVKAKLRYVNTNINITLGEDNVKLTTPTVPDIYKENINYSLNGTKGGNYILQAQKNLKYKISGTGLETFSIILDQNIDYSLYSVKLEKHKIIIDNTEFEINEDHPPKNIIFHYTHPSGEMENAIYDFKSHKLLIDNIHFDFDGSHVPSTLNELKDKIDSLSGIYQNEGFVEINHFPLTNMPSFDHSVKPMPSVYLYYKGWYDLKKKEFISYLNQYNSDYSITALEFFKFKLLGKFENKTYYYNFVDHVVYFEDTDGFLKPLLGSDLKIENPIFGDTEGSLLFKDSKKNNVYNINLKNKKIGSASINLNLTNKNRNTDRKFKEFSENISEYDVNLIDKNFNVFISPENIVLSLFIKDKIDENNLVAFTDSNLNDSMISEIFSESWHQLNLFYHDKINSTLYILNKNNSKKIIASNIKNAQLNQGHIIAESNDGSRILFSYNSDPTLLLLNIASDKENDIEKSLIYVKKIVPNLKINSYVITNLSDVCLIRTELSEMENVTCV